LVELGLVEQLVLVVLLERRDFLDLPEPVEHLVLRDLLVQVALPAQVVSLVNLVLLV